MGEVIGLGGLSEVLIKTEFTRARRIETKAQFIKGPLLLDDIAKVALLPGHCLIVYLLARYRADVTRKKVVSVPEPLRRRMEVSRYSYYRAVEHLAEAGLVTVDRRRGRSLRLTLVEGAGE
jgi:hypothetical protein